MTAGHGPPELEGFTGPGTADADKGRRQRGKASGSSVGGGKPKKSPHPSGEKPLLLCTESHRPPAFLAEVSEGNGGWKHGAGMSQSGPPCSLRRESECQGCWATASSRPRGRAGQAHCPEGGGRQTPETGWKSRSLWAPFPPVHLCVNGEDLPSGDFYRPAVTEGVRSAQVIPRLVEKVGRSPYTHLRAGSMLRDHTRSGWPCEHGIRGPGSRRRGAGSSPRVSAGWGPAAALLPGGSGSKSPASGLLGGCGGGRKASVPEATCPRTVPGGLSASSRPGGQRHCSPEGPRPSRTALAQLGQAHRILSRSLSLLIF